MKWSLARSRLRSIVLRIAGQEHPNRRRFTEGIKQWMAAAVDTQLNQTFTPNLSERKFGRRKEAGQKKVTLASRIASNAATKLNRGAARQSKPLKRGSRKTSKGMTKELQKPGLLQEDGDVVVVKTRPNAQTPGVSSSVRFLAPSRELQN